jgi:hypothetical protein
MSKEQEEQQPKLREGRDYIVDHGGLYGHWMHIPYDANGERILTHAQVREQS